MQRLAALLFAFLCLAASPAYAAWSVTTLGGGVVHNSSVHSVTTSSLTVSSNHIIAIVGYARTAANADPIVVSDGAGDTFTVNQVGTGTNIRFFAFAVTTGLSAQTVSVSDTSTGATNFTQCDYSIVDISGGLTSSAEDAAVRASITTASTTSPALTSGSPVQSGELFLGLIGFNGALSSNTFTEDAAWTQINQRNDSVISMESGYFVNAGSSANTRTVTNPAAHVYDMMVMGFFANGAITPVTHLSLTGAGK